jgi:hypothetical protein
MQDIAHVIANEITKRSKSKWQASVSTDYYTGTIVVNCDTRVVRTRIERKRDGDRCEVLQAFDSDPSKWQIGTRSVASAVITSDSTPFDMSDSRICVRDMIKPGDNKLSFYVTPKDWEPPATLHRLQTLIYKLNLAFCDILVHLHDMDIEEDTASIKKNQGS